MKKNRTHILLSFLGGLSIGVALISFMSFSGSVANPGVETGTKISLQEAQTLTARYAEIAHPMTQVLKGFAVNREQLDVMNRLLSENSALVGFRVYLGMDGNNTPVNVIVGMTGQGNDNAVTIFKTSSLNSGPCPTICDESNSITTH